MYKNNNKLLITLFIWMFLAGNGFIWAFIFCGVGTSELSGLDDPLPYRIVYLFLAAVNIGFIVLCGVKYTSLLAVNQINSFFAADEDGYVPLADLSKALNVPEYKTLKYVNDNLRKGYLINFNYDASERAFLLSDKYKPTSSVRFYGEPENRPFIGVHCPGCAASLKIRSATAGTCPYCGREIVAPEVEIKD